MLASPNEDETAVLGCHCTGEGCAHVKGTGQTAELVVCTSVLKSEMFTPRTKCLSLKNCVPGK